MRESLGQEPQWNAGRRARSVFERAPHASAVVGDIAPFGVLLPFCCRKRVEKSFVACRVLILTVPVLHCRDRLTKIGKAVKCLGMACSILGARTKSAARERESISPLPPTRAARGGEGSGVGGTFFGRLRAPEAFWFVPQRAAHLVRGEVQGQARKSPPPLTPPRHSLTRIGGGEMGAPRERKFLASAPPSGTEKPLP
jgi:hypothetical protein